MQGLYNQGVRWKRSVHTEGSVRALFLYFIQSAASQRTSDLSDRRNSTWLAWFRHLKKIVEVGRNRTCYRNPLTAGPKL